MSEQKRVSTKKDVFIKAAWTAKLEGKDESAIAEATGMKLSSVLTKLSTMRNEEDEAGNKIDLPTFEKSRKPGLSILELNKIAAQVKKELAK